MEKEGQRIRWKTLNGFAEGTIVGEHELGWNVLLESGAHVIVNQCSVIGEGRNNNL